MNKPNYPVTPVHIAEIKKLRNEIDRLKEEKSLLAWENKNFDKYLTDQGFSNDGVTAIATGCDVPQIECDACNEYYEELVTLRDEVKRMPQ